MADVSSINFPAVESVDIGTPSVSSLNIPALEPVDIGTPSVSTINFGINPIHFTQILLLNDYTNIVTDNTPGFESPRITNAVLKDTNPDLDYKFDDLPLTFAPATLNAIETEFDFGFVPEFITIDFEIDFYIALDPDTLQPRWINKTITGLQLFRDNITYTT
jgi:hypothetical protein